MVTCRAYVAQRSLKDGVLSSVPAIAQICLAMAGCARRFTRFFRRMRTSPLR